ncbi:hypothetical protein [Geomonas sp.]|uniref:hypothetical protein n=1 Tax=Geomonas sp. TaxID=2651584 RepID=UPI002B472B83|nr:hypothetical protein [Geomonas sp.]
MLLRLPALNRQAGKSTFCLIRLLSQSLKAFFFSAAQSKGFATFLIAVNHLSHSQKPPFPFIQVGQSLFSSRHYLSAGLSEPVELSRIFVKIEE